MSLQDRFDALVSPGQEGSDKRDKIQSEAWRPRLEVDQSGGFVITTPRPASSEPKTEELLQEWDLDPAQWVVTNMRRSRWQRYDGEWLEAYRLTIAPNATSAILDQDLEQLMVEMKKWRPGKAPRKVTGDLAYNITTSDQQIGKRAGNDGTAGTVNRILETTEGAVWRLSDLRKIGRAIGTGVLSLTGDHVEGTVSQGGRLLGHSTTDLGITQEVRVGRRVLMTQIKALAPHFERFIVAVVNGNHDEATRQVATNPGDGWNVEIAAAVQDACAENPALEHIEFRFPELDQQTLSVEINGVMLGLFHGHQAGRDVLKYLSGQAVGLTPLGACDIWVSGHFHSYKAMDIGERLWMQAPTLDPGSNWFRDRQGLESPPGVLTFVMGAGHDPRTDISVITTKR